MKQAVAISQKELSRVSGFSQFTISRALAGHANVADETRVKIEQLAKQYNYRPNAAARAIRSQKTHHVGVVLPNSPEHPYTNPPAFEMLLGINQRLSVEGYLVSLIRIGDVEAALEKDSRAFQEQALDGLVLSGELDVNITNKIRELIPQCFFVDGNVWEAERCIQRDEVAAGQLAARALIQAGCRRLGWWGIVPSTVKHCHYSACDRYAGVQAVAREAGVPLDCYEPYVDRTKWDDFVAQAVAAVRQPGLERGGLGGGVRGGGLGIVANNINGTLQWISASAEHGLTPPKDYRIASADSTFEISTSWPHLSRVLFDRFDMGVQIAEMMMRVLKHPDLKCPSRRISPQWYPGRTI